jgi:DNA polymerase-3 subunit epsilon
MRFGFEGRGCFPTGRHYPGIAHLLRVAVAGLVEEFDSQIALSDLPLAAIDTETTGRDPETDRIVELALVVFRDGSIVEQRSWLINPERPIAQEAFEVHGISDEQVKGQPTFAQILPELSAAAANLVPLAYNADFDKRFILNEVARAGVPSRSLPAMFRPSVRWLDPLIWARLLQAEAKSKSLGAIAEVLGVTLERAHRATDDAAAAMLVMREFFKDIRVPKTYGAFMQEQMRQSRVQDEERQYWRIP